MSKRITASLFILINVLHGYIAYNQSVKDFSKEIPSPEAATLKKFLDHPVGIYSGTPEIKIPIYTINDGMVELPISLSYNSSGIGVSEEASWVGLGWNLSVGGMIVQSAVGELDLYSTYSEFDQSLYPTYVEAYQETYPVINKSVGKMAAAGEFQPDVFYFSFPGHSGKFYIDYRDNSIHQFKREKNLKFERIDISGGDDYWNITDETGIVYVFDLIETANSNSGTGELNGLTFYLSEIIYLNGQHVYFEYDQTAIYQLPSLTSSYTTEVGQDIVYLGSEDDGDGKPPIDRLQEGNTVDGYRTLKRIITDNFEVTFTSSTRDDLFKYPGADSPKKLDGITIKDRNSQDQRTFSFQNSYFVSNSPYGNYYGTGLFTFNLTAATKRLKLDAFYENGGERYEFYYSESIKLPIKTSYAVDYWGHFNGEMTNNVMIPKLSHLGVTDPALSNQMKNYGARRAFDFDNCKSWMLEKIIYPTGGTLEYLYEPNTFNNRVIRTMDEIDAGTNINSRGYSFGGGIRVKSITMKDGVTQVYKVGYTYDDLTSGQTNGVLLTTPIFHNKTNNLIRYFDNCENGGSCCGGIVGYYEVDVFGYNASPQSYSMNASNVGYGKVVEKVEGTINNGEKRYYFYNSEPYRLAGVPEVPKYLNGSLVFLEYVNSNGSVVRSEDYDVQPEHLHFYAGISAVDRYNRSPAYVRAVKNKNPVETPYGACWSISNLIYQDAIDRFAIIFYALYSYELRTESKTSIQDGVTSTTDYTFNSLGKVIQESSNLSNNTSQITTYQYSTDVASGTNVYQQMVDKNFISPLVRKEVFIDENNDNITDRQVNGEMVNYRKWNNLFFAPENSEVWMDGSYQVKTIMNNYNSKGQVIQLQSDLDVTTSLIYGHNGNLPIAKALNANSYEIAYTSFETGSPGGWTFTPQSYSLSTSPKTGSSYHQLGYGSISFSFSSPGYYNLEFWGQGPIYFSGGTVTSVSQSNPDQNGWIFYEKLVSIGPTTLTISGYGYMDELRVYPSDAQIITYTYKPLFGITSEESTSGNITYYLYDSNGRLYQTKDQDGNVLKQYDYNYAD